MSVVAIDARGHATDVPARPLSHTDAAVITGVLHRAGIPVLVSVDAEGFVRLWPERALSTLEEVQAFKAITDVTDSRIAWRGRWPA